MGVGGVVGSTGWSSRQPGHKMGNVMAGLHPLIRSRVASMNGWQEKYVDLARKGYQIK